MSILLLALALGAPVSTASDDGRSQDPVSCSVSVGVLDAQGHARSARRVSAAVVPAVVFRGKVSAQEEDAPPLLFDVFNPPGQRYQVLFARPRVVTDERGGHRARRSSRVREAALAVAGSSIAWTSMYGKWRVEPRLQGESEPCGPPQYFTIRR